MKNLNEFNRMVLLTAVVLLFSIYNATAKKNIVKGKFKQEISQTFIGTNQEDDFIREREELVKRMEVMNGKIDKQLADLREQSLKAKKEAQKSYKADIDKLDAWIKKLEMNIKETRSVKKEQWEERKITMIKYLDDLERQLEKVKKDTERLFQKDKEI